jgi:hypothetical protein
MKFMKRQVTMAIFGNKGFIRKQETAFAKKMLVWQYEKSGRALPDDTAISAHAQKVVADAHRIAKNSSLTVVEILKNLVKDIKK